MMYEIGQEGEDMHYLEAGKYTYLAGEINALYHEAVFQTAFKISYMYFAKKAENVCKVR